MQRFAFDAGSRWKADNFRMLAFMCVPPSLFLPSFWFLGCPRRWVEAPEGFFRVCSMKTLLQLVDLGVILV